MRLNNDKKVRLLRSCAQVKIIELTEKIIKLKENQTNLLNSDAELMKFVTGIYKDEISDAVNTPTSKDLIDKKLKGLKEYVHTLSTESETKDFKNNENDIEKVFESNLRTYSYENALMHQYSKALEEYRILVDKTSELPININNVKEFMDSGKTKHTDSFLKFSQGIKSHTPMHLALTYGKLADQIATRNNIADKEYSSKAGRVFKVEKTKLALDRAFKGRLYSTGKKIAATVALAAFLTAGVAFIAKGSKNITETQTQGQETEFIAEPIEIQTTEQPSTEEAKENQIFTNSIKDMETYEEACTDYFEKISDIYKYNTGKEIDLSGYGQKQIGYNPSAQILIVEQNGETFIFSGQGDTAPNYKYLKEALEATGANVQESNSSLSCIIDKNDPNRSIAITDSKGDSVRSGKVLVGSNNAYNPDYVSAGREILEAQGIKNPSEAECVGVYLLSNAHSGDPDLDKALGEVQSLTRFIKGSFYYRDGKDEKDGKSDPYTVYLYAQKSEKFAEDFEAKQTNKTNPQAEVVPREHDDR